VRTKSTVTLLVAAAALFAFIYWFESPARQQAQIPTDRKIFPDLDIAKITAFEIQKGGAIIRLEKTNHSWQLTQPVDYPANAVVVSNFFHGLAAWEWQTALGPDDLANNPDPMREFGFDPPEVSIILQGEGRPRVLNVGHQSPVGDQAYLNPSGSTAIYVASIDLLTNTPGNETNWRDLQVLDLTNIPAETLEVRSTNSYFKLTRDPITHLWMLTAPLEQHRADTAKIDSLLSRLQDLTVSKFVSENAADASRLQSPNLPALELKFLHQETNPALGLKIGATDTNNPKLAYARRLSPANLIEIALDPLLPWETSYTNFLDHHLTSLPPEMIDSIQVSGEGKFTVQKTSEGAWTVIGSETFPADNRLMKDWLSALTNIEVDITYPEEVDLARFGLANPGLQYQITYAPAPGQTNPTVTHLHFGTNQTDAIFERRTDEHSVNTISRNQLSRLPRAYWELRNLSVWNFPSNEVQGIDVHERGTELHFRRGSTNQWVLAVGPTNYTVVSEVIDEVASSVSQLRAVYWSGVGEERLAQFGFATNDYRIDFELRSPHGPLQTNTIEFGRTTSLGHCFASIVRDGRRLIFEFPADLYIWVNNFLGVPEIQQSP
jgi:Domain of unknown function (DUF4340)